MTTRSPDVVYLPSFHGDVKLSRKDEGTTELRAFQLTAGEQAGMEVLRKRALRNVPGFPRWAEPEAFLPLRSNAYQMKEGVTVLLRAPILKVHAVLAPALRPDRQLLTAERREDGRLVEISWRADGPEKDDLPAGGAFRTPAEDLPGATPAPAAPPKPKVAATVARPTTGCPMPDFGQADVRATEVLVQFLTAQQLADYRREGAFLVTGIDSGHQYAVIHRERPDTMARYGGRQLFDFDEHRELCIHDWLVPPAEEMLALLLHLRVPGQERYLRYLHDQEHTA